MVVRICFVCLGNICRSPTAEAVMRGLVSRAGLAAQVILDSAGTGDWHVGEPADRRARAAARQHGYEMTGHARQFVAADFARFDLVLAMDRANQRDLEELSPDRAARARIRLFRSFDPEADGPADVPDPYYGGVRGFDDVIELCERTCQALLDAVRRAITDPAARKALIAGPPGESQH